MDLTKFVKTLFENLNYVENKIQTGLRFNQSELNEILRNAKSENTRYLERLSQINRLSAFDISFLLSSTNLDEDRIAIIKQASQMYNDSEFSQVGQTFSDFIFRVAANIDVLNSENLGVFKELVNCKNEIYDLKDAMKNGARMHRRRKKEFSYAFDRVLMD